MTTREDLSARIQGIIAEMLCLEPHEVRDDSLLNDLTDDFGRLEIIMAAEELADAEIADEDAENLKTVADVIAFVAERLGLVEVAA